MPSSPSTSFPKRPILHRLCAGALATSLLLVSCGAKPSELLRASVADAETETAPGVTADAVKVGFVIVDQSKLGATLGFQSPDSGDVEAQIMALADAVNDAGGLGGRDLVPVVRVFDALTDSAANEEKLCRAFTEDDRVFAVVLNGMFQENARPCYAEKQTLMLDQTLFPVDTQTARELAPYLFQPSIPEYGEVVAGLAIAMQTEEFLSGDSRLGVLGIDNDLNRRVTEDVLLPQLDALGVEPQDIQWADPTSNATLQATQNQAVLAFKEAEVDRVIVVGGSRLLPFLLTIAIPQQYYPKYAVTTFDNPNFVASGDPEAMLGSIGISLLPGIDLQPGVLEFPSTPAEQRCLDIFEGAGETFAQRENARESFLYCDAVDLLAKAFPPSSGADISAQSFAEEVAKIGPTETASNYSANWEEDDYAGASSYRVIRFDAECECYDLVGEPVEFP